MAEYVADPCPKPSLSSGCAFRLLNESPLHAWHYHPRLGGRASAPSDASEAGTTAHDMLLGGEGRICEIRPEDYRSKPTKDDPEGSIPKGWTNLAIRTARDTARANGLTPMLAGDLIAVRTMVKAAREFIAGSEIAGIFDSGASELTVIANEGDLWMRCRPDWLTDDICLSYKTSKADIAPRPFRRLMASMGYDFSLAFYDRVLRSVEPGKRRRHIILVQEQDAPYACALYDLTEVKAKIEEAKVEAAIELWQRCLKNGWPGFSPRVQSIDAAPWELAETEVSYA
jgi:hypothetical protein